MNQWHEKPELTELTDDCKLLIWDSATQSTRHATLETIKNYIGVPSQVTYEYMPESLLWLEGSLTDQSGNNRNASPVGANSPSVVTGLNSKPALRWNGSGNQELQVSPFLSGTTDATLYCVFTVSANTNYNLVRTANLDDYWRFTSNGAGYLGVFRSGRFEGFPSAMPSSGSHLISIHADGTNYEVLLNNQSIGSTSSSYSPGDRFRIGTNDKAFNGDISLLMVYPFVSPSSSEHQNQVLAIKQNYPSLSLFI